MLPVKDHKKNIHFEYQRHACKLVLNLIPFTLYTHSPVVRKGKLSKALQRKAQYWREAIFLLCLELENQKDIILGWP